MELFKAKDEKRLAESKRRQVELTYDDLRGKLTLGVVEGREAILSGRVQIEHASEQVRRASESYRLSDLRLKQARRAPRCPRWCRACTAWKRPISAILCLLVRTTRRRSACCCCWDGGVRQVSPGEPGA